MAWIPVIEALSADHRTYAVNHIFDIGRSVYTRPMQSPDDFVQWLEELFTAPELDSLSLIGHSYGGWQASLYALTHPERLDKLVLLAPASTVLRPPLGLILRAMLYYFIPTRFVTKRYLYWYAPDAVRRTDTREIIHEMIDEDLLARRCFNRSRFIAPTVLTDEDWQNLQVRTLFLVGENDVTYSAHKAVRRLNRVAPHVETMICPEADHHLALVQPEWVSNNALEFLQTPRSRSLRAWSSVAVPTCGVGEGPEPRATQSQPQSHSRYTPATPSTAAWRTAPLPPIRADQATFISL